MGARSRGARRAVGSGRIRVALFLAVALAMTGVTLVAYGGGLLDQLELATVDARFSVREAQPPPEELVVVEIDDVTFSDLGIRWPYPRTLHGEAIDAVSEGGAKVIAYDVQFTEPSGDTQEAIDADNALIDAVARAGNVVLATTEVDAEGRSNVFGGDEVLREIGARAGNALLPPDEGGVIRRVPYQVGGLVSFGVAVAEEALGRRIDPGEVGGDSAWIDFQGPPGTIRSISFSTVLRGDAPPGLFRDRIVVIGPSAPTLQDVHPTSTTGGELMAGAEIEANAIWTALQGFPLQSAPDYVGLLLIVLFGFLPPLVGLRVSLLGSVGVGVGLGAAFVVLTQVGFERGTVLPFVYPFAALALSTVGSVGAHYSVAAFERQRVRDIFSRFVPEQVVDQVLERTGANLRLGGENVEGTIMFTDLRGFTSFSETLSPHDVIDVINTYLTEMSEVILDNGGTLVSYAGDGIMAVFGAPITQEDHADRALATARDMVVERLPRFNAWMREQGYGEGFRMGIGLNSGTFISGNVGSVRRLEYTAIGDVTNTASRIEGLTKGTRHMLLLSGTTRDSLRHPPADLVFVDEFDIRGRKSKMQLWSLESASDPVVEPEPAVAGAPQPAVP